MIYAPEQFVEADRDKLCDLIRTHSFATLISDASNEAIVTHLPVTIDASGSTLHAHVARANPVWRDFASGREILLIFNGPHHYISPSWYTAHPSVPTWNYAVVHVSGVPTIIEDHREIEAMLKRMVEIYESSLGTRWTMDLPAEYLRNMIEGIVAFEVRITRMIGKYKLSQNRSRADRLNVIAELRQTGGENAERVAVLMQQLGNPE